MVDKPKNGLLISIAAAFSRHIAHIDKNAAYWHKTFGNSGSEHPRFDRTFKHSQKAGRLDKNIYGTPGAGHILRRCTQAPQKYRFK